MTFATEIITDHILVTHVVRRQAIDYVNEDCRMTSLLLETLSLTLCWCAALGTHASSGGTAEMCSQLGVQVRGDL